MKMKRILLIILVGLSFAACSNSDKEWVDGKLDVYSPNLKTGYDGILESVYRINVRDINGWEFGYDRLYAVELFASRLKISSPVLPSNSLIYIDLGLNGRTEASFELKTDIYGDTYINDHIYAYSDFVNHFVHELAAQGDVELFIRVDSGIPLIPITIDMQNDLDLLIRER